MILAWGFIIHLSIGVTSYNMQYFHFDLEEGREEETHSPWVTEWKNILYTVTLYISIYPHSKSPCRGSCWSIQTHQYLPENALADLSL